MAVSFPKRLPPGGEGKISLKVNTAGYGGRTLNKSAIIESDDPLKPAVTLTISGAVERFARITPPRVTLNGVGSAPMKQVIEIVAEERYPFRVVGAEAREGKFIRFDIEALPVAEGPSHYRLTVENRRVKKGRYYDTITLKTDSPVRPSIHLQVYGNIVE